MLAYALLKLKEIQSHTKEFCSIVDQTPMLFGTPDILIQQVRSYDLFLLIYLSLNFHVAEATDVVSNFSYQLFSYQ